MAKFNLKPLFIALLFIFSNLGLAQAGSKTVQSLSEGPPAVAKVLGQSSFVPVEVKKLANASVWYVDYEWHRKQGIEVPPEGIQSPTFHQAVLDAYAWQTPSPDDPADAFTSESKRLYADYYGGYGMATNHGSGRAAASGIVQIKGTKTPLAISSNPSHSNGAVQTIESVDEAIWSEILDRELKYGSNKVVAVIFTKTYGRMKDEDRVFFRTLIIREMDLRPAHFMLNYSRDAKLEQARLAEALPQLLNSLPYPKDYSRSTPENDLRNGIFELLDREATVQAEYFAKRMFFGSVSPSNLEITGRRLDLGDHTSQEGYSPIYRLGWQKDSPFGSTNSFLMMFEDFRSSLSRTLPGNLISALPKKEEFVKRFNETFRKQQILELVRLTGAPHEMVDSLANRDKVKKLGSQLLELVKAGHQGIQFMDPQGWEDKGTYKINLILTRLGASSAESVEQILEVVKDDFQKSRKVADAFARSYFEFRQDLKAISKNVGLTESALQTYMKEASKQRNKSRPSLVRGDGRWKALWNITDAAIDQNSPAPVENYIEEEISKNIFNFKDAGPFQVVVEQKANRAEGATLRKVFDAKQNQYVSVLRIETVNGSGYFNGQKWTTAQLKEMKASASTASGKVISSPATESKNIIEFSISSQANVKLNELRMVSAQAIANERMRSEAKKNEKAGSAPICRGAHL